MMTMNEKLMMLPIFKGIGEDALLQFLEKTHLDFKNYEEDEILIEAGDDCESLTCLISGEVEVTYSLCNAKVNISASYGIGKVIGLDRLFGMDTHYSYSVKALSPCGTMEFTKPQYMQMVQSNNICMLNFLNSLSYGCQSAERAFNKYSGLRLEGRIARLLAIFTDKKSKDISIMVDYEDEKTESRLNELQALAEAGLIAMGADGSIKIISRSNFLDYAEEVCERYY